MTFATLATYLVVGLFGGSMATLLKLLADRAKSRAQGEKIEAERNSIIVDTAEKVMLRMATEKQALERKVDELEERNNQCDVNLTRMNRRVRKLELLVVHLGGDPSHLIDADEGGDPQ